jgi:hypothetical protein
MVVTGVAFVVMRVRPPSESDSQRSAMASEPLEESVNAASLQSGALTRPLNFTVRPHMGKRRYTLALLFLISLSGCIETTTYVSPAASGTVVDDTSKKPIQGATISVDDQPGLFAQTNSDGRFVLVPTTRRTHIFLLAPYRSLPPGGTIVVSADGYVSREVVVDGSTEPVLVSLIRVR